VNIAIVGAAGSCGRQLTAQLLDRHLLPPSARLQLVGHQGGRSADELWGLRADLEDAFVDDAPAIEVVLEPSAVDADLVVMLAGVTIATDPNASVDRVALGHTNRQMFVEYADALAARPGFPPVVIVQSNPVELGVQVFAERLGRQRVLGAGRRCKHQCWANTATTWYPSGARSKCAVLTRSR
jgi:malate dehydrogenase